MPSRVEDLGLDSASQSLSSTTLAKLHDERFDPANFLNDTLPPFSFTSTHPSNTKDGQLQRLQDASSELQTYVSTLNAHNIRCSSSLSQLTDEILRSGSRLAYEVEILRGNVNNLHNVLTDTLKDDVRKLVPANALAVQKESAAGGPTEDAYVRSLVESIDGGHTDTSDALTQDPQFIVHLRTLNVIKARLESTIKAFGEAMQWPLAPSELSMTSSLISVSAPELGMVSTSQDDKAREISKKIKDEVIELLESDGGGFAGVEAAFKRVNELRDLTSVWKGTAEEKPRVRFVDGLAKVVEDRKRALDGRGGPARPRGESLTHRSNSMPVRTATSQGRGDGSGQSGGFLRNLQKLRDEIYLE